MYQGAKQGLQNAGNAIYQDAQNLPYNAANAAGRVAGNVAQGANWLGKKVNQGVNQANKALSGVGNAFSKGYQQGRK